MKRKSRNYSQFNFLVKHVSFLEEKKPCSIDVFFKNEGCIGIVAFFTLKDIEEINQSFAFQHLTIFFVWSSSEI